MMSYKTYKNENVFKENEKITWMTLCRIWSNQTVEHI